MGLAILQCRYRSAQRHTLFPFMQRNSRLRGCALLLPVIKASSMIFRRRRVVRVHMEYNKTNAIDPSQWCEIGLGPISFVVVHRIAVLSQINEGANALCRFPSYPFSVNCRGRVRTRLDGVVGLQIAFISRRDRGLITLYIIQNDNP